MCLSNVLDKNVSNNNYYCNKKLVTDHTQNDYLKKLYLYLSRRKSSKSPNMEPCIKQERFFIEFQVLQIRRWGVFFCYRLQLRRYTRNENEEPNCWHLIANIYLITCLFIFIFMNNYLSLKYIACAALITQCHTLLKSNTLIKILHFIKTLTDLYGAGCCWTTPLDGKWFLSMMTAISDRLVFICLQGAEWCVF